MPESYLTTSVAEINFASSLQSQDGDKLEECKTLDTSEDESGRIWEGEIDPFDKLLSTPSLQVKEIDLLTNFPIKCDEREASCVIKFQYFKLQVKVCSF